MRTESAKLSSNAPAQHPAWLTPFLGAFELLESATFPEHRAQVFVLEHRQTAGKVVVVSDQNPANLLRLSVETRASDDSGMAHITDHVRTRHSEMLPGISDTLGLANHGGWFYDLNAWTLANETSYFVTSDHPAEAERLGQYILQAALAQHIGRREFEIEGFRVAAENGQLFIRGIVQKEVCGYEGSPSEAAVRHLNAALYPDTHQRFNYAGTPEAMRALSFERFKAFNEQFYHPSHARVFIAGSIDPTALITETQALFERFPTRREALPRPIPQPFETPRMSTAPYPWAAEDLSGAPTVLCTGWVLPECWGKMSAFELDVLNDVLLDQNEGVIPAAFRGQGLACTVTGGLYREYTDSLTLYCYDLGIEDQAEVEAKILATLSTLCAEGISSAQLMRSLQRVEFSRLRSNVRAAEKGLEQSNALLASYERFGSMLADFGWAKEAQELRCHLSEKAQFYVDMLRRGLCENPHRASVAVYPDKCLAQSLSESEAKFLKDMAASMQPKELEALEAHEVHLRQQARAMLSGDLKQMPVIALEHIPAPHADPPIVAERAGGQIIEHAVQAPGLYAAHLVFDLAFVPKPLRTSAALLPGVVSQAPSTTNAEFTQALSWAPPELVLLSQSHFGSGEPIARLCFALEGLTEQLEADLARVEGVLDPSWITPERVRQAVIDYRHPFSELGHAPDVAAFSLRAGSNFSASWHIDDQTSDLGFAEFLDSLLAAERQHGLAAWKEVTKNVIAASRALWRRQGASFQLVHGDAPTVQPGQLLEQLLNKLPDAEGSNEAWSVRNGPLVQGVILPSRVSHISQVLDLGAQGVDPSQHGALLVLAGYLANIDFWRTIRAEGSAYSVGCDWGHSSRLWTMESGWNPDPLAALSVFKRQLGEVKHMDLPDDLLQRSKIAALREFAPLHDPFDLAWNAFWSRSTGLSSEAVAMLRGQILRCTGGDPRALHPLFDAALEKSAIVVAGPASVVNQTLAALQGAPPAV